MRKINMQVSLREKSTCNKYLEQTSARNKFIEQNQFQVDKFKYKFREKKTQQTGSFINNNQQVTSSKNKNIFTMSKIIIQVSRRKNQHVTSFMRKIGTQQAPRRKISTQQVL